MAATPPSDPPPVPDPPDAAPPASDPPPVPELPDSAPPLSDPVPPPETPGAAVPASDPPPAPEPAEPSLTAKTPGGDAGSLQDLLDAGHRLSASQALLVGLEAARVLMRLHGEGLKHGGVTASNLVFDAEGRVRLTEPDSTRQIDDPPRPETGADPANDIRDLGLVIHRAVIGAATAASDETPDPDATSVAEALGPLQEVVARAVSPRSEDRPGAADLARDLIRTAESLPRPEPFPLIEPRAAGPDPAPVPVADVGPDLAPPVAVGQSPTRPVEADPASVPVADAGPDLAPPVEAGSDSHPVPAPAPPEPSPDPGPVLPEPDPAAVASPPAGDSDELLNDLNREPDPVPPPRDHKPEPVPAAPPGDLDRAPVMAPAGPRPAVPLDDASRRRWPGILLAVAVVAAAVYGGVYAWRSTATEPDAVPDFEGRDRAEAIAEVTALGWTPEVIQVRRPGTEPGEVVETEPEVGTELESGQSLRLFVSLGPPLVSVPDVVGLLAEAAEAELEESGFAVSGQVSIPDDNYPPGTVVGTDLPSWITEMEPGAEIGLIVSAVPVATG